MGKTFKVPKGVVGNAGSMTKPSIVSTAPKVEFKPPTVDWTSGSEGAEVFMSSKGAKSLIENLQMLPGAALDAAGYEMAAIAAEVIADAKENYVPILTFALRDSGDSDEYQPNRGQTLAKIVMWFGGIVTSEAKEAGVRDVQAYALEQHENLEFHHPALDRKTGIGGPVGGGPPGSGTGGPKYLERPLTAKEPTIYPRLAKAIAEFLGGNTFSDLMDKSVNLKEEIS